ncbi:hypothetical protein WJR50_11255 [Catalinimonas sp. 4WD22]|uniref:hypothetical protein n=1 Tax=Catalinimonas locisalis TaxID=3133978 RepID=UPI0031010B85
MKGSLFIIAFLFTVKSFACSCDTPGIIEKYLKADFVAVAKITKVYSNEGEAETYKSDIQIDELYKGEALKSIYVYGRSDGEMGSSCAIFIPENTRLIVYARKNEEGKYGIGMCSGLVYLNDKSVIQLDKQRKELQILNTFKANGLNSAPKLSFWNNELRNRGLSDSLDRFKSLRLDKSFGIYAMSFNSDLTIKNVEVLSGYNDSVDAQLISILKNCIWGKQMNIRGDIHPEKRKQLIGIYFYEEERGNPSFLSQFYL